MPTISFNKSYLESLTGVSWDIERWEEKFTLVKGELKDYDQNSDEIKLELADSNRPDLWSCEGIARQIKYNQKLKIQSYDFFHTGPQGNSDKKVIVSAELEKIRPFIATCSAFNLSISEELLLQLIQTQEKLSENFGKKREIISIGIYNLEKIQFPISYKAVRPNEITFIPLGFDATMTLSEIVELHPKGIQYGHILSEELYPILIDSKDEVLSFPPIINSKSIGEVKAGDTNLFIEVTGTDIRQVMLALNILAVNLADVGARIETTTIEYPYDTKYGNTIVTPMDSSESIKITTKKVESALGIKLNDDELQTRLESYGHQVKSIDKNNFEVKWPPYRDDIMADVDIIEDFAISRGYDSFIPVLPVDYTVGSLSDIELLADKMREYIIGFGFQEVISNILCSIDSMSTDMLHHENKPVEIENIMSQSFAALRSWIIPMLLKVEQSSSKAFYPHKIFETGDVAVYDKSESLGSRTLKNMAAIIAHGNANFSEIHSCLDLFFYYLNTDYHLQPITHPSFISGRVGGIIVNNKQIGFIGELHPNVLENWDISIPCTAFELTIDMLLK